jgi:hypothetical protein
MYLGAELCRCGDCKSRVSTELPTKDATGTSAFPAAVACGFEKLGETFDSELPGSVQFRLQHNRAIEASGVLLEEWAFLQQSGMLAIGQLPSCAPA